MDEESTITLKCLVCRAEVPADTADEPRVCDKHWRCPKCGCSHEYVDEDGLKQQGLIIESEDNVVCYKCDNSWTYRGLEQAILCKDHMEVCPTCKGAGVVKIKAKTKKR